MMNKELMGGVKKFLGKMQKSDEFRRFIHKNPDAFLCSGFFVIDNEGKDNKIHFDYYCPKSRKMFSFEMENEWRKADLEIVNNFVPSELLVNYDITFENLERLIDDKMNESNIKNKVQKMIFSLQRIDGKDIFVGAIFISMLGLLKVHIDPKEKKMVLFEKKSFFDIMKVKKSKNK